MIRILILATAVSWLMTPSMALSQPTSDPFQIRIEKRKVMGERVLRVKKGDTVRLHWSTDEEVDLHLHGYNIKTKVKPGEPATVTFDARATGRFPVTTHGFGSAEERKKQGDSHSLVGAESALIYIEVHPR